jgi:hypothetical protein
MHPPDNDRRDLGLMLAALTLFTAAAVFTWDVMNPVVPAPLPPKPPAQFITEYGPITNTTNNWLSCAPVKAEEPKPKVVVKHVHHYHTKTVIINLEAPGCRTPD